jgi:hypothetical protein
MENVHVQNVPGVDSKPQLRLRCERLQAVWADAAAATSRLTEVELANVTYVRPKAAG